MSSKLLRKTHPEVRPMHWEALPGQSPVLVSHGAPGGTPRLSAPSAAQPPAADTNPLEAKVQELERRVEQSSREAFEKGLRQGEAEGRKQALAQLDGELQRLSRTIVEMAGLRPAIRREAEEELVRLALAIARRILHRELTVDPEALTGLVKAALEKLEIRDTFRVRTHPDHAGAVERCLAQIGAPRKIEVVPDPSLEKGGVVFETGRGSLDASAETQLAEIQRGLADLMH